jgi:tetratricopeptide (TPR) repeat protein
LYPHDCRRKHQQPCALTETTRAAFIFKSNRDDAYFTIGIEGSIVELTLSLYGPDRRMYRSAQCIQAPIRISEIAKTAGAYRLELKPCDRNSAAEYRVVVTQPRTAVKTDYARVDAERTVEQARITLLARPQDNSSALRKYEEALAAWRNIGDRVEEIRVLQSAGRLYRDSGDLQKAEQYLHRALELSETEGTASDRIAVLQAVATLELRKGECRQGPAIRIACPGDHRIELGSKPRSRNIARFGGHPLLDWGFR